MSRPLSFFVVLRLVGSSLTQPPLRIAFFFQPCLFVRLRSALFVLLPVLAPLAPRLPSVRSLFCVPTACV